MDEEEIKMNDGVARFFTRFGGIFFFFFFFDVWEAQPCVGDAE